MLLHTVLLYILLELLNFYLLLFTLHCLDLPSLPCLHLAYLLALEITLSDIYAYNDAKLLLFAESDELVDT